MQNFTTEDLLEYLYGEITEIQKKEIESELVLSWALNEKLKVLKEGIKRLNNIKLLSPRRQTVDLLLHYAENTARVI